MIQEDTSINKAINSQSLNNSIKCDESEDAIVSILADISNLDEIWTTDELGRNPLHILHQKYYSSVFEVAFHSKTIKSSPLLHDEWYTNPDWKYVATISNRILSKVVELVNNKKNAKKLKQEISCDKVSILHEAFRMSSNDCPIDILRLMTASPYQHSGSRGIEWKDENGNIALHLAIDKLASKLMHHQEKYVVSGEEQDLEDIEQHQNLVLDLIEFFPSSVRLSNHLGEFPIQKLLRAVPCESSSKNKQVNDILDPLWKACLPTKDFFKSVYCNSSGSSIRSSKILHLLLSSTMGDSTRRVDIFFQIFQDMPWILKPSEC